MLFLVLDIVSLNFYVPILDVINNEKLDEDSNDISNRTLDSLMNKIPIVPRPEKNFIKNKKISDTARPTNNIPSENKYINIKESQKDILAQTKDKAGVYMFFNLVNGNSYIGSSVNLARRFRVHISCVGTVKLPLYRSISKYGPNNFVYLILQYCEKEQEVCLALEQYYLDLWKPKYNILKIAGSSKGYKHTKETLKKMHVFLKRHNAKKRLPVEITDTGTNITTRYESILATAAALNTNEKNVRYAAKLNKLLLNKYLVKIIRNS